MYPLEQQREAEQRPSYQVKDLTKHNLRINGVSTTEVNKCSDKTGSLNKLLWLRRFILWATNEE